MITWAHLRYSHNMTNSQYRKKHPGANMISDVCRRTIATGKPKPSLTGTEGVDYITCRVVVDGVMCGKRFRQLPKHLKHKHKMSSQQYKVKYPGTVLACSDVVTTRAAKTSIALTGRTKEDYPYLVESGRKSGQARCGRTKLNDPGRAAQAKKLASRSKKTHQYMIESAEKNSAKAIARWKDPEWRKTLTSGPQGMESKQHIELKERVVTILTVAGWAVIREKWITIDNHLYRVDGWAQKDGRKIIVEVGGCSGEKFTNLRKHYGDNNVFVIPYGSEEIVLKELEERCSQ